jgi:Fe2+ transport system protein FeoA
MIDFHLRLSLIFKERPAVSPKSRSLAALPPGRSGVVTRVRGERSVVRRLLEVGLVPGTRVTLQRVAPLGDPIELRVRNYALSIRRSEALGIEIE